MNVIIPARGGSKSIYKKNIYNLCGRPLIDYTIKTCLKIKCFERVIVSTEDKEIADISLRCGAEVPFMRPEEFSLDNSSDYDFLKHFFDNVDCEDVALMRPTSPLRDVDFINECVEYYYTIRENITGFRTSHSIEDNPYKVFKLGNNGIYESFFNDFRGIKDFSNLPRQTFPQAYKPDGHIDIIKKETILTKSVFGDRIGYKIGNKIIDIDSMEDMKLLEIIIKQNKENKC